MRDFGVIHCTYWTSETSHGFSDDAKLLGAYLMTGPHSNILGCYRLPDGYVTGDLSWEPERVTKGFEELSRKGFANRFEGVVFIPNFLRWNHISNANVAKARQAEFEALPKGEAKTRTARAMLTFGRHWSAEFETVLQTISETLSKGYAKQNPTQPNPDPTQPESKGSPDGEPENSSKPTCLTNEKAERLRQVTHDAVEAYNSILGKPIGKLSSVRLINEVRESEIKRSLKVAREICKHLNGEPTITQKFWADYFGEILNDAFKNGTGPYTGEHANWRPDFEYLTRPDVMTKVFDKAMSEQAA